MRVYGRVANSNGTRSWVAVQTDSHGNNDLVMATALCQCLQLSLNESPFYAQSGLPAHDSFMQQIAPDYYVSVTQQNYAPFFASLVISKNQATTQNPDPSYSVSIITHQGVPLSGPIPT